jgi:hypothetical protein
MVFCSPYPRHTYIFLTSKDANTLITGKQHFWCLCWEHESLCLYGANYLKVWKIKKLNYVSVDAYSDAQSWHKVES